MTEQQQGPAPGTLIIQVGLATPGRPGVPGGVALLLATGTHHQTQVVLDADTALQVAEQIRSRAREAKRLGSGLVLPADGLLAPPNGHTPPQP